MIAAALFVGSAYAFFYEKMCRSPVLRYNRKQRSRIDQIVRMCPSLHRIYWPSILCMNSHWSVVPFVLYSLYQHYIAPRNWKAESVELPDGESIVLYWIDRIPEPSATDTTPVVMIHHGANCSAQDLPGQGYIQQAIDRGWIVCAFDRRGHGASRLTRGRFNFFGSVADVKHVTRACVKRRRPNAVLFMVGLSAGSALVARYMGEQGRDAEEKGTETSRRTEIDSSSPQYSSSESPPYITTTIRFAAAVGVCPGYDIERCMSRFSWPYDQLLLMSHKAFLRRHRRFFKSLPGYNACIEAKSLQAWLDNSFAIAGYESASAYYDYNNPMRVVPFIKDPCLFINAADDPICVAQNVEENAHIFDKNDGACLAYTQAGSHIPFFEFGVRFTSWAERVTYEFFDAALKNIGTTGVGQLPGEQQPQCSDELRGVEGRSAVSSMGERSETDDDNVDV